MSDPLVLIPARLAATRLPNKPLAEIAGEPMIVHVWRRAMGAGVGPVAVATDAPSIAEAVERAGGRAVMTRADHPSGSDRIHEAVEILDPVPFAGKRPAWRVLLRSRQRVALARAAALVGRFVAEDRNRSGLRARINMDPEEV